MNEWRNFLKRWAVVKRELVKHNDISWVVKLVDKIISDCKGSVE
jgi:hypothetical protein